MGLYGKIRFRRWPRRRTQDQRSEAVTPYQKHMLAGNLILWLLCVTIVAVLLKRVVGLPW